MKASRFWSLLAIITVLTGLAVAGIHSIPEIKPYAAISWLMLILMSAITIGLYYLGISAVQHKNPYTFIRLVVVSIMAKILLILILIISYIKLYSPENRFFVLPFIGIYLVFSIYETIVLYRIASTKSTTHD
jgi:hypothetical protein